jgi:hypothetical protein
VAEPSQAVDENTLKEGKVGQRSAEGKATKEEELAQDTQRQLTIGSW